MEDRTPRFRIGQLAARTGVARERLRKWEARYRLLEPTRSEGGFRLYSLEDERRVRLMQRHLARGYAAAEAAELAIEGLVSPAPARMTERLPTAVVARAHGLLRQAMREYDEAAAQRALDDLLKAFTIDAVLRDAILPFLREIGERWAAGRATPGQEHFASTIIEARLLSMTKGWGSGSGPRALLACPAGERHTLGLIVFGIALSRRGWRITYLGADTPGESIARAADHIGPTLVTLSSVRPRWYSAAMPALTEIAEGHRLVLAGAGATKAGASRAGAECTASDPVTLAAEIVVAKAIGPRDAGRSKLGGWDSNPQPTD
jgi:MerR family transcriptional regulator, light-induced transcriptional regulator